MIKNTCCFFLIALLGLTITACTSSSPTINSDLDTEKISDVAPDGHTIGENERIGYKAAQKVIDACWEISQELRDSTSTMDQRNGSLKTGMCMQKHIKYLFKTYLFTKDYNKDTAIQSIENMDKLHDAYARLYWDMFNSNNGTFCHEYNNDGVCNCLHDICRVGLIYQSFHNWEHAKLMEHIMKDTYHLLLDRDIVTKKQILKGL